MDKFWEVLLYIVVVFALLSTSLLLVSLARSDGQVTYCYTYRDTLTAGRSSIVTLRGHRDWRTDLDIYHTTEEGDWTARMDAAIRVHCPGGKLHK